jgi:hypothetical protein
MWDTNWHEWLVLCCCNYFSWGREHFLPLGQLGWDHRGGVDYLRHLMIAVLQFFRWLLHIVSQERSRCKWWRKGPCGQSHQLVRYSSCSYRIILQARKPKSRRTISFWNWCWLDTGLCVGSSGRNGNQCRSLNILELMWEVRVYKRKYPNCLGNRRLLFYCAHVAHRQLQCWCKMQDVRCKMQGGMYTKLELLTFLLCTLLKVQLLSRRDVDCRILAKILTILKYSDLFYFTPILLYWYNIEVAVVPLLPRYFSVIIQPSLRDYPVILAVLSGDI